MSVYSFLSDSAFLQERERGNCFVFRDTKLPEIKWSDVVFAIDDAVQNNTLSPVGDRSKYGMILRRAASIRGVGELMEQYGRLDPSLNVSAHCYVSLSTLSGTLGRHRSKSTVLFWQAIGYTSWTVDTLDGTKTFALKPNDLIYCPSLMYHDVKPLTPRVGISLGLDHLYPKG